MWTICGLCDFVVEKGNNIVLKQFLRVNGFCTVGLILFGGQRGKGIGNKIIICGEEKFRQIFNLTLM